MCFHKSYGKNGAHNLAKSRNLVNFLLFRKFAEINFLKFPKLETQAKTMENEHDNPGISFLTNALSFIPEIWNDPEQKCNQKLIARKLGITGSYLSKAKENEKYANNLKRKVIQLIRELGGDYDREREVFIDLEGNTFDTGEKSGEKGIGVRLSRGMDGDLFLRNLRQTKTIQVITTWGSESYANLLNLLEQDVEVWASIEKIQLLLLHPNSQATYLRSKGVGFNLEKGFNRVKDDLQELINTPIFIRNKLEVRLYDELPGVKLIMLDGLYILGFFLFKELSRIGTHVVFNPKQNVSFAANMKNQFRKLWNSAEPFHLEKDEQLLERWQFPEYKRYNKKTYNQLVGTYYLYYPERFPSDIRYRNHKVFTTIGCNVLSIKEGINGQFICQMKTQFDPEGTYSGEVMNQGFNNPGYLVIRMKNLANNKYIELTFPLSENKTNDKYYGYFSIIYQTRGGSGAGYALLVPRQERFEELESTYIPLETIHPNSDNEHLSILGKQAIRYLIQKRDSLLVPSNDENMEDKCPGIEGVFRIYAAGRKKTDEPAPDIIVGILEISPFGTVRFKNRKNGYEGVGWAHRIQSRINIELTNSNPQIYRTALFSIEVGNKPLTNKSEGSILCGVNVGTTWMDETPVASRIILEYCPEEKYENLTPEKVAPFTKRFEQIPEDIREALIGRLNNLIGFFNQRGQILNNESLKEENKMSPDLKNIFFKAACFDALQGEYESAISLLTQAISYGFRDLDKFSVFLSINDIKESVLNQKLVEFRQVMGD